MESLERPAAAHQLRDKRRRLGLTQYDLSKLADVNRFSIAKYESGIWKLTDRMAARLHDALDEASRTRQAMVSIKPGFVFRIVAGITHSRPFPRVEYVTALVTKVHKYASLP